MCECRPTHLWSGTQCRVEGFIARSANTNSIPIVYCKQEIVDNMSCVHSQLVGIIGLVTDPK